MLSEEQKEKIIKFYKDGYSIQKIANLLKHGKNSINKIVRDAGIVKNNNSFNKETEEKIAKEYIDGNSASILGTKYGCSLKTILNIVNRHGLESKPRGNSYKELSEDNKKIIEQMWDKGCSRNEILECINVGHEILDRWLIEIGKNPKNRFATRENHPMWKGGKRINGHGYVEILLSKDDPFYCMTNSIDYVLEHRYVMAKHLNKVLYKCHSIHHIDGNRANNNINNLELRTGSHPSGITCICNKCGSKNIIALPLQRTEYNKSKHLLPKKSRLFTEEQEQEIVFCFKENKSISNIAKEYNTTRNSIRIILIKNGIELTGQIGHFWKLNNEEMEKFKFMWIGKVKIKKIKKYFNVSGSAINRWVKKIGLPLRRSAANGNEHGNWNGGKIETKHEYVFIHLDKNDQFYCMINNEGYVAEHRYIMAQHLNRSLTNDEKIHHIDGNRKNNDIKNLQLVIKSHGKGQRYKCVDCESIDIISVPLSHKI